MRLLCFPHAGASAMAYLGWRRKVPERLEIRPVELPGRGSRMTEPALSRWDALLDALAQEVAPDLGGPYALFGHSMGALVAFEMAHKIKTLGLPAGEALIVSGADAPSRRDNQRFRHQETDADLQAEMRRLNGTEEAVFSNEELMRLTLPVLRADFKLCANYRHQDRPRLDMPLHVMAGVRDETTEDTLMAWRAETVSAFSIDYFDGGHFFIKEQEAEVLNRICRLLS